MDHSNFYLKARSFFSGTLLSRISGMGRDLSMAFAFGDHPSVAAFMIAFRLSNLFRRLLGEGPFQTAFVPYFEGLRVQDPHEAVIFFRRLVMLFILLLLGITGIGEIAILAASSFNLPVNDQEILNLTAWMLPGLLFICLYGLNISFLHCHETFFIPSVAPFVCNMIWIVAALLLQNQPAPLAMSTLSKVVVIGFFSQWLLTLPATLKHIPLKLKECFEFRIPPQVVELAKLFTFGAIGVGAVQVNAFLDVLFARYADLSGPVYLWYSIRLEQLALAVLGFACVSTVVPQLSRLIKSQDMQGAQNLFSLSFKRILFVMIPATFALFALGGYSVNLLYGHGHFSEVAISQTTLCLWAYGIGLVPATMIVLMSSLFYASSDFKTPTKIAVFTILVNLLLNSFFVFGLHMGAVSTALATSISLWVNFGILSNCAKKQGWVPDFSLPSGLLLILASILATLPVIAVEYLFLKPTFLPLLLGTQVHFSRDFVEQITDLAIVSSAFLGGALLLAGLTLAYRAMFKGSSAVANQP